MEIRKIDGINRCFIKVYYYAPAKPTLKYIVIKNSNSIFPQSSDTTDFDTNHPIKLTGIEKRNIEVANNSIYYLSKPYPCYYIKEIEIIDLQEGKNTISCSINALYFAGFIDSKKTYYARTINLKINIFKIKS